MYILLAKISGTPYFFDYFSILLSFDLKFIQPIDLWSLNIHGEFQPYTMRIRWQNAEKCLMYPCINVKKICCSLAKFCFSSDFSNTKIRWTNLLLQVSSECFGKESIQKVRNNTNKMWKTWFMRYMLILLKTEEKQNLAREQQIFFTLIHGYKRHFSAFCQRILIL